MRIASQSSNTRNMQWWLTRVCAAGCLLIVVVIVIVIGLVARIVQIQANVRSEHRAAVETQQAKWASHEIDDYVLEVTAASIHLSMVTITVRDGHLEKVIDSASPIIDDLSDYQVYTIDSLFDAAFNCMRFCAVEYEPIYGFPNLMRGDFIESSLTKVTRFEILPSD